MKPIRTMLSTIAGPTATAAVLAQGFAPPVDVPLPATFVEAAALVTGDVDGDGAPDLVVTEAAQYHVLLGNGAGGFGAAATYAHHPIDVLLASRLHLLDWNGDGRLDLVVGHMQGATVSFGDGTGAFAGGATLPDVRRDFAFADVNSDGRPDFVGLRIGDQPVVGLGGAATTWGPLTTIGPSILNAGVVMLGDVDRDGDVDVVVQSQFAGGLTTLLGDGSGAFGPPLTSAGSPTFSLSSTAALVDANGDSILDVVWAAVTGGVGSVRIAIGDGTGAFAASGPLPGPAAIPFGVVDVDADGRVDLVAVGDHSVAIYAGTAAGGFAAPTLTATANHSRLVTADFDRDGRVDVAAAGSVLQLCRNGLATPTGIVAYGAGTAACAGTIGVWGTPEPAIGQAAFRVACSNAPPNAIGLFAMGTRVTNGWDPLGIGLTSHLGFVVPFALTRSDVGGGASVGLPIPNVPWLAGLTVHAQSFWFADPGLGNTCSPAWYELASSRGLSITLQD